MTFTIGWDGTSIFWICMLTVIVGAFLLDYQAQLTIKKLNRESIDQLTKQVNLWKTASNCANELAEAQKDALAKDREVLEAMRIHIELQERYIAYLQASVEELKATPGSSGSANTNNFH